MYKMRADGSVVTRIADNAGIPIDADNRDYQEFLAWQAEGNVPESEFTPEELAAQAIEKASEAAKRAFWKRLWNESPERAAL